MMNAWQQCQFEAGSTRHRYIADIVTRDRNMNCKVNDSVPLKVMGNLYCGSCNLQFFIKDFTLKGSRCPVLLHCGHSICESCIQQNLKVAKVISCQLCDSVFSLDSTQQTIQCFPLNLYLVGNLVALQNSKQGKDKGLKALLKDQCGNLNYAVKEQENLNLQPEVNSFVCEECSLTALWYCENCKSNFCETCWSRVHGSAKSLMRHCKSAIGCGEIPNTRRKCSVHESQDMEFYCKTCSATVCSHCVILQHQGEGHCPITLKEKNLEMISSVKTATEEAEKISKRMRHTLEKLKLTQDSEASEASFPELELQIRRNFSRAHGLLQLEEERLLDKLQEFLKERENCTQSLRLQLENQIENVEGLLRQCEIVVKKPLEYDLTDLHKRLTEVQQLPCYLISRTQRETEAKVTFNENAIQLVKKYCTIDLPCSELFELCSSSNLPDDYAVEPLQLSESEQNQRTVPRSETESSVSDADTFSNCSSRDLERRDVELSFPTTSKGPMVFQEKRNYSVRVSYIKNPGEFYVTLNSQRYKQQAIDRRACSYASCSSNIPTTVAKDEIYLVQYSVDKKWYRARVIEVFSHKKATGTEECVLVYYFDYGNSETVPISRLRPIPADMLEPPLAVKCKLFDCVPKDGVWCIESIKTMEKILDECTATMFVMKVHRHCLEVDLSVVYPDGQIGRDIVSVRDALLFLEYSSFVHGSKIPRNTTVLKYLQQCLPQTGETFDIFVTHVNSPSDFYVQNVRQDASYLKKLTMDLQRFYSGDSEKGVIYNPTIGMPCAALFSADKRWYRAKIVDIPGKQMVTVFYIDYGNQETVPWTNVRRLKEYLVKRPALALNCSLADVHPVGDEWSAQATSHVEKCVLQKGCRVQVQGRHKSSHRLKVALYKEETCVNRVLVDMGLAVKAVLNNLWKEQNRISQNLKTNGPCQAKSSVDNDEDRFASPVEIEPLKRRRTFKDQYRSKLSAKKLRELHESEKKSCGEASSSEDAENEVVGFDNIFKVKVKILSAETPSCIYVTFPALMEEFKNVQKKLNEFYQNSSPAAVEWAEGSVCAVYDAAKGSWFRASVISIDPDDQVKVFLKDLAEVSLAPKSALRELDASFAKYASCAVKCHLADVRPPGELWPSVSSEYLLSELENFSEVYMTKRGHIDNKSLPVELWVQKMVLGGALEPSTKEWVTLNRLLVEQGLAIPTKQKMWRSGPSDEEDYSNDVGDSEIKEVVKVKELPDEEGDDENDVEILPSPHWLPPEPLAKSVFVGMPTYVDDNAYVHVYDTEQDENKLKMIREALLKDYGNSQADSQDHFWSRGEPCIARYHGDSSWYRGIVTQINENLTHEVLFVDYGNVETCQVADLRKGTKMQEIPILSRKFQLQGITPASEDGTWPVAITDLLHSLVVDKRCEITVLKPALDPAGPHLASLKVIENGVDVAAFLVEQHLASFSCSVCEHMDSSESDVPFPENFSPLSSKPEMNCYIPLDIPSDCRGFFIHVTAVKSETEFFANIAVDEGMAPDLKSMLTEFEELQKVLTDECHLQPLLTEMLQGHPCCCVRLRSNKWCRGEIQSFVKKEDTVCVFYVDHGDTEFLNKDLLHVCKREWLSFPKMAVKLRLANADKYPNVSKSVYMKALTSCLSQKKLLFAEILSKHEEVLEVRVLSERNGALAYQEMIDKKLMLCTV